MNTHVFRLENISVVRQRDGSLWLRVKAPTGKMAAINLGNLQGPVIKAAFLEWATSELQRENG